MALAGGKREACPGHWNLGPPTEIGFGIDGLDRLTFPLLE